MFNRLSNEILPSEHSMNGIESVRNFVPFVKAMRQNVKPVGGRLPEDFSEFPGAKVDFWYYSIAMNDDPNIVVWRTDIGDKVSVRVSANPKKLLEITDVTISDDESPGGFRIVSSEELSTLGQIFDLAMKDLNGTLLDPATNNR